MYPLAPGAGNRAFPQRVDFCLGRLRTKKKPGSRRAFSF
jgi:hypothetical protein